MFGGGFFIVYISNGWVIRVFIIIFWGLSIKEEMSRIIFVF